MIRLYGYVLSNFDIIHAFQYCKSMSYADYRHLFQFFMLESY